MSGTFRAGLLPSGGRGGQTDAVDQPHARSFAICSPTALPFRAWSNFEFRDDRGNWSEVDLLLLAPDGLHLVELKYYSGRLRGSDQTWLRDGHAAEDSPLLLANRKAKRLRSKLMNAYTEWARSLPYDRERPSAKDAIPYVQESVFLHHPDFVCELPESARRGLYGLPGNEQRSGLAPISELFTGTPRPGIRIYEKGVAGIMGLIGVRGHRREAGSYVLESAPLEDGPGWQDWTGTHKVLQTKRRIRFRIVPEGSPEEARRRVRLIATHEMRVMQHLSHDAILRPEDYVESELGPGLVCPYDPAWQRLDFWLAGQPTGFDFDAQLDLMRRIAEALQYAHGKNVVHRGLSPRAILVRPDREGRLQVRLTDWQGVGRTDEARASPATRGVTMPPDDLAKEIRTPSGGSATASPPPRAATWVPRIGCGWTCSAWVRWRSTWSSAASRRPASAPIYGVRGRIGSCRVNESLHRASYPSRDTGTTLVAWAGSS